MVVILVIQMVTYQDDNVADSMKPVIMMHFKMVAMVVMLIILTLVVMLVILTMSLRWPPLVDPAIALMETTPMTLYCQNLMKQVVHHRCQDRHQTWDVLVSFMTKLATSYNQDVESVSLHLRSSHNQLNVIQLRANTYTIHIHPLLQGAYEVYMCLCKRTPTHTHTCTCMCTV